MLDVSIEITKLDEDIAERAVHNAYSALKALNPDMASGITVEPHSNTRGIHAVISLMEPPLMNSVYVQSLTSAFKALLSLQIYKTAAKVSVRTETVANEEQEG